MVTSESIITPHHLPDIAHPYALSHPPVVSLGEIALDDALENTEKQLVLQSFRKHQTTRKVAIDLRISQTRATKLIREYCKEIAESN